MAQEILSKKVPLNQVAMLILFSLPNVLAMSTPFATLLGTLMTVGRLSTDNEITVMLASGLSYRDIFIPAIIVGIIVSSSAFVANDVLLPAGQIQFNKLYRQILASTPALELESNSVKRFKNTVVVTGNVDGSKIDDMLILDRTGDGERRVIMAKSAQFKDAGKEGLALDMENAFIQSSKEVSRRDYDYASTSFLRYRIPQEDLISAVSNISPREMASRDVASEIKKKSEVRDVALKDRAGKMLNAALSLETVLRNGPTERTWRDRASYSSMFGHEWQLTNVLLNDRNIMIYRLEYYKKFSLPLGALSLIILAIPLGLLAKKNGQAVGFILGLIVSVFYWILMIGGQNMGIRLGYSPFWTMWIPDIAAASIGVILILFRIRK
jgi:lipopolysaccharide export system permease protein